MKVIIPDVLQSYTGAKEVDATGESLSAIFHDLERQFPGIRFRVINELDEIRPNIKLFVNGERETDLATTLSKTDELFIMQALSGG